MFGTKRPSITSMCSQRAAFTRSISSPSRQKSAAKMEGATTTEFKNPSLLIGPPRKAGRLTSRPAGLPGLALLRLIEKNKIPPVPSGVEFPGLHPLTHRATRFLSMQTALEPAFVRHHLVVRVGAGDFVPSERLQAKRRKPRRVGHPTSAGQLQKGHFSS